MYKPFVLIVVIVLILFGTSIYYTDMKNITHKTPIISNTDSVLCEVKNSTSSTPIYIYTIDSCEYIGYVWGTNSDKLTHKGNCKYCQARLRKMIRKELSNRFD